MQCPWRRPTDFAAMKECNSESPFFESVHLSSLHSPLHVAILVNLEALPVLVHCRLSLLPAMPELPRRLGSTQFTQKLLVHIDAVRQFDGVQVLSHLRIQQSAQAFVFLRQPLHGL